MEIGRSWQFHIVEGNMISEAVPYIVDLREGKVGRFVGFSEDCELVIEDIEWKFVTEDLFARNNIYFTDIEIKKAERKAEELFMKWIQEHLS